MAGLGRRTHYRKHVTDSVLHDFPEPLQDESIAVVVQTRGSNQFDVQLPHSTESQLAILPTKFRKLVWLKRNDYVIVQTASTVNDNRENTDEGDTSNDGESKEIGVGTAVTSETTQDTGSIRCVVKHILYSDQIKHLRSKGLWPVDDPIFDHAQGGDEHQQSARDSIEASDGIVYDQNYGIDDEGAEDADLFINTNRVSRITLEDDPSSSDESGNDD